MPNLIVAFFHKNSMKDNRSVDIGMYEKITRPLIDYHNNVCWGPYPILEHSQCNVFPIMLETKFYTHTTLQANFCWWWGVPVSNLDRYISCHNWLFLWFLSPCRQITGWCHDWFLPDLYHFIIFSLSIDAVWLKILTES